MYLSDRRIYRPFIQRSFRTFISRQKSVDIHVRQIEICQDPYLSNRGLSESIHDRQISSRPLSVRKRSVKTYIHLIEVGHDLYLLDRDLSVPIFFIKRTSRPLSPDESRCRTILVRQRSVWTYIRLIKVGQDLYSSDISRPGLIPLRQRSFSTYILHTEDFNNFISR